VNQPPSMHHLLDININEFDDEKSFLFFAFKIYKNGANLEKKSLMK
jgi:hypothetical protein